MDEIEIMMEKLFFGTCDAIALTNDFSIDDPLRMLVRRLIDVVCELDEVRKAGWHASRPGWLPDHVGLNPDGTLYQRSAHSASEGPV